MSSGEERVGVANSAICVAMVCADAEDSGGQLQAEDWEQGQAEVSRYRYHQNVRRMISSLRTGALVSIV